MSGRSRLTVDQVVAIREALRTPYIGIGRDLAVRYRVSNALISHIRHGTAWKRIGEPPRPVRPVVKRLRVCPCCKRALEEESVSSG